MIRSKFLLLALLLGFTAISQPSEVNLTWKGVQKISDGEGNTIDVLLLDGGTYVQSGDAAPAWCQTFSERKGTFSIKNFQVQALTQPEISAIKDQNIPTDFLVTQNPASNKFTPYASVCVSTVRKNSVTGAYEKLISFSLEESQGQPETFKTTTQATNSSVLRQGTWKRLSVARTGIYKITPEYLSEIGFNISGLSINNVRLFGNHTAILPELTNTPRPDDLQETPLYVVDANNDGIFNGNDALYFFATGPHQWQFNATQNKFEHSLNIYRDLNYLFITIDNGTASPMSVQSSMGDPATQTSNSFDDFDFVQEAKINLVGAGRDWYGDVFEFTKSYNYEFSFPDMQTAEPVIVDLRAAGRSSVAGTFMQITLGGQAVSNVTFPAVFRDRFMLNSTGTGSAFANSSTFNINLTFNNNANPSAVAWLDYLRVNVRRSLIFRGGVMTFRDKQTLAQGGVVEYQINNPSQVNNPILMDVTDPNAAFRITPATTGGNISFRQSANELREYVVFNPASSAVSTPDYVGNVQNQNLHAEANIDYVIVSHPNFLTEANRLADFHRNFSSLNVKVFTPQEIYNEYSSGGQDVTAIRDFMRMLYQRANTPEEAPKYLLMFGRCSYDYKSRVSNNTNFVPVYQSAFSESLSESFLVDDYFGFLDDGEGLVGTFTSADLDVGVGRMPIKNLSEARAAVDKSIRYSTSAEARGNWRNRIVFVADDVDEDWERYFAVYKENASRRLDTVHPQFNINKIYMDAYQQVTLAGSQRYPEARDALVRRVNRGNLYTAYLGHGGEVGWASERVLTMDDINSFNNRNELPVVTTITCQFTRYDDPSRISGGEVMFLRDAGGAISLYTTTRSVYGTPQNYQLNERILFRLLDEDNQGRGFTFGNVVVRVKNQTMGSVDRIKFSMVGDPALRMGLPVHNVVTDSINGIEISQFADTLKALQKVTISGRITDVNGNFMSNFNGVVTPEIFDKPVARQTLMNDGVGPPIEFETQENVVYRGQAEVSNGRFRFSFIVPKDIALNVDNGKISYYAQAALEDASGANQDFLIGSIDPNAPQDNEGPLVNLFLNDENFVSGGLTGPNPLLLARVSDSSGINTVGTGLGHDIVAILDNDVNNPIVLNDYYEADLNSFQSGVIRYPFYDLKPGKHTLKLRVWDVYNNPSEATIEFNVAESDKLVLDYVLNWPNPFTTYTEFHFEHNRPNQPLDVQVQVFTVNGKLVKTINQSIVPTGNRVTGIAWDGLDDFGDRIGRGVYVYRLKVRSQLDQAQAEKIEKLVILR